MLVLSHSDTHYLPRVYGPVRVPRDLDYAHLVDRSLLPWSTKVSTSPKFSIWMMRETLRDDSETRIRDKKSILMSETVCCCYPWVLVHWICLCFLLFLCTRMLTLVVVDSSWFKIEEFLNKMAISLKNCRVEQKNYSSIVRWHDLLSVVIICSDFWIFWLFIWTPLFLFHSPRHQSRRRSLLMLVLPHSDTHYLNGHMVGCGCHQRSDQSRSSQAYMA